MMLSKSQEIKSLSIYHFVTKASEILIERGHICEYFKEIFNRMKKIMEEPLKLAILGEFSAGKSTFINRLLDIDILPTKVIPTTKVVTVLEYSSEKKIEVIYRDAGGNILTKEFQGYDKLKNLITGENIKNELFEILKVRVFIGNDILKYFHIIDTPGFNDPNKIGEKVIIEILDEVNYVIWIFRADQAGKNTEKTYLDVFKQKSLYKNNIFAFINYGDVVVESRNDYERKFKELNEALKSSFRDYFVNDNILLISCKKRDEFWNEKFNLLVKELKDSVLEKDKEISVKQLSEEYKKLTQEISSLVLNLEDLKFKLSSKLDDFIQITIGETVKNDVSSSKERIVEIIKTGVEDIQTKICSSSLCKRNKPREDFLKKIPSLLKFASFYFTAEKLEDMRKEIEKNYHSFVLNLEKYFKDFVVEVNKLIDSCPIKNERLEKDLKKSTDTMLANFSFLKNTKQLMIIGYIIGLLSDDKVITL